MYLYAITIVLSAFLLFLVQPIIAKLILPWFGGTSAVWTTCLLFFQSALLLGYLYVDVSVRRLSARAHTWLHMGLLAVSLALLPILPSDTWKPTGETLPTLRILLLLSVCVGLPYILLSATSPLLQSWYTRSHRDALPYRLFALSNIGSLIALLGYPFLLEPHLHIHRQGTLWSVGYGIFVALCLLTAWMSLRLARDNASAAPQPSSESAAAPGQPEANAPPATPTDPIEAPATAPPSDELDAPMATEAAVQPMEGPPSRRQKLLWLWYAATPSALLMAVTSHLTHEVAAMPFLWILPLALYLLTFVLCFDADGWYKRWLYLGLLIPALVWMAVMVENGAFEYSFTYAITSFSATFFIACMFCHGELVHSKPAPRYLTSFYLMLSLGGALGGVFVGLIAPLIFADYFELPLLILSCSILAVYTLVQQPQSIFYRRWEHPAIIAMLVGIMLLFAWNGVRIGMTWYDKILVKRNFYGVVKVRKRLPRDKTKQQLILYHGAIRHGDQWLAPKRRRKVVSFYCPDTGVGRAMRYKQSTNKTIKIGVLGLGAGTIAGFARKGDTVRFYEINPAVIGIAEEVFYFIKDARKAGAKIETVLGDARLSLERENKQQYDLLILDCFSSDAIPVHLLTKEAIALYFSHLKPNGVVALHVSNHFVKLDAIVGRIAKELNKASLQVETNGDSDQAVCYGTTWLVLANDKKLYQHPIFQGAGKPIKQKKGIKLWTDAYSSLFDAVGW